MDNKGQAFVDWPGTMAAIIFLLCLGVILAQIMPALISNFITPGLTGTQSGDITIFLYYLIFPAFVIMLIFVVGKNLFTSGGG